MTPRRHSGGFTLIELLVVMAIIATLAGIAAVGIPAYLRGADKTADAQNLQRMYGLFMTYQQTWKGFPTQSGPDFVFALWTAKIVDHNVSDAKIFFSAGTGNTPPPDLDGMTADDIDYTGPQQENRRTRIRTQMRNANNVAIVCNRLPAVVESDADLDDFPHAARGINVLFAGGDVRWYDTEAHFGGDYPVIGPESPVEELQNLVPDDFR